MGESHRPEEYSMWLYMTTLPSLEEATKYSCVAGLKRPAFSSCKQEHQQYYIGVGRMSEEKRVRVVKLQSTSRDWAFGWEWDAA